MRKLVVLLVLSVTILVFAAPVNAGTRESPDVYVKGHPVITQAQADVPVYYRDDHTMVPLRFVSDALGAEVIWNGLDGETPIQIILPTPDFSGSEKLVMLGLRPDVKEMTIWQRAGDPPGTSNWSKQWQRVGLPVSLDVAPEIVDDRTFVPLRFIAEKMGCNVRWDEKNYSVNISEPNEERILDMNIYYREWKSLDILPTSIAVVQQLSKTGAMDLYDSYYGGSRPRYEGGTYVAVVRVAGTNSDKTKLPSGVPVKLYVDDNYIGTSNMEGQATTDTSGNFTYDTQVGAAKFTIQLSRGDHILKAELDPGKFFDKNRQNNVVTRFLTIK